MQGEFHIMSLSIKCLVGDDGRHCRAKAECSVILTDDKGIFFVNAHVNSLLAASPVEVSKSYLIYGMSSAINNIYFKFFTID